MALDPPLHFPDIGSYIKVFNAIVRSKDEIKDDLVDSVEQLDSDFLRVSQLPSYISNTVAQVNSITTAEANNVTAVTDYKNNVLTVELPSAATTVSGVITDFFAAMVTAGETFMSSATGGNFADYYEKQFLRTDVPVLPSGSNSVDDALAT